MLNRVLIFSFMLFEIACAQKDSSKAVEYDKHIFEYQFNEVRKHGMSKDEYLRLTKPFSKWDSRPLNDAEVWIMNSLEPSSTVPNLFWGAFARHLGLTPEEAMSLPDQFVKTAFLNKEEHKRLVIDNSSKIEDLITVVSKSNRKIIVTQKQFQRVDNLFWENGALWQFRIPSDSPFPISDTLTQVDASFSELDLEILEHLSELEMHGVYKVEPVIVFIKDGLLDNSYGFIVGGDGANYEKLGHLFRIKLLEKVRDNIFFYIAN